MIELRNLSKRFVTKDGPVEALSGVSLKVNDGDIYGIIGMSGAGKSTLVRCINMLERPTEARCCWTAGTWARSPRRKCRPCAAR